ncbi:unnamed protein product [Gordionus sp. m RMFG-2023]
MKGVLNLEKYFIHRSSKCQPISSNEWQPDKGRNNTANTLNQNQINLVFQSSCNGGSRRRTTNYSSDNNRWWADHHFWKNAYRTYYAVKMFQCYQNGHRVPNEFKPKDALKTCKKNALHDRSLTYSLPIVRSVKNSGNHLNGLNITASKMFGGRYVITGHCKGHVSLWEAFPPKLKTMTQSCFKKRVFYGFGKNKKDAHYSPTCNYGYLPNDDKKLSANPLNIRTRHRQKYSPKDLPIPQPLVRINRHTNAVTDIAIVNNLYAKRVGFYDHSTSLPTLFSNVSLGDQFLTVGYDNAMSLTTLSSSSNLISTPQSDPHSKEQIINTLFIGAEPNAECLESSDPTSNYNFFTTPFREKIINSSVTFNEHIFNDNRLVSQKVNGFFTNHSPETLSIWKNIIATDGPNNSIYVWKLVRYRSFAGNIHFNNRTLNKGINDDDLSKNDLHKPDNNTIHASLLHRKGKTRCSLNFRSLRLGRMSFNNDPYDHELFSQINFYG